MSHCNGPPYVSYSHTHPVDTVSNSAKYTLRSWTSTFVQGTQIYHPMMNATDDTFSLWNTTSRDVTTRVDDVTQFLNILNFTAITSDFLSSTMTSSGGNMSSNASNTPLCMNASCGVTYGDEATTESSDMTGKDASWILTSAVIIFTMQTGFGLLESGAVDPKNEVNIMVKNALDVVFGGITYWAFGFGLSFGSDEGTNSFVGVGWFLFDSDDEILMGYDFALFLFQLSFSTTATTIVSGAMAERTRLSAYIIFSLVNTIIYCIPAHWVWAESGFLFQLGALDVAGCGPVHLVGGVTGLVATIMLKPRQGVFDGERQGLPNPIKVILGTFMLWWGWLRFNSGSVFIISDETAWALAVRAAVNTMLASLGGGITAVLVSLIYGHIFNAPHYDVGILVNGILGSLVSITSICTMCRPWESIVIGLIGCLLAFFTDIIVYRLKIDDPVGVVPVHLVCAVWGLICVGFFVGPEYTLNDAAGTGGLLKTGEWYLLGVQTATASIIIGWTVVTSYIMLKIIDVLWGLRLSPEEELMGADVIEHGVERPGLKAKTEAQLELDRLAEEGEHEKEFKVRLHALFHDLAHSCDRNNLNLVLSNSGTNRIQFEMSYIEKAPSLDSGIQMPIHISPPQRRRSVIPDGDSFLNNGGYGVHM